MRLFRADVPDTGILRRHHRQTVFDRLRIVAIGDVNYVQGMFDRHADHGVRQPFDVIHIAVDGRVAEVERQHVGQFIKIAFINSLATQQIEVAEDGRGHFIAVCQAFVRQSSRNSQHPAVAVDNRVGVRANTLSQPLLLQPIRERTGAAITDHIGHQLVGFAAELVAIVINAELHAQDFTRHRRDIVNDDALLRIGHHRDGYFRFVDIVVRHATVGGRRDTCQLRQRLVAVDHRLHQVGGIPAIAKGVQGIKHRLAGLVAQRFKVTAGKLRAGVRRVNGFCADLRHPHPVAAARHRQLGVDYITLAVGIFFIQQRSGDGVGQAIDRAVQSIVFYFKIEGSAVRSGTGVMAAAVHFEIFGEAIRLRVLFRPHQRHMLQEVGQSLMLSGVLQRPHGNDQRRQRFYRLGIGNQQHHHAVIEADRLILTGIFVAFTDGFLNRLPSGVCLT